VSKNTVTFSVLFYFVVEHTAGASKGTQIVVTSIRVAVGYILVLIYKEKPLELGLL
jgi:hypothetical protein